MTTDSFPVFLRKLALAEQAVRTHNCQFMSSGFIAAVSNAGFPFDDGLVENPICRAVNTARTALSFFEKMAAAYEAWEYYQKQELPLPVVAAIPVNRRVDEIGC